MIAAARDGRRPHGHANGHIFLREEPRATCKARAKDGPAATPRAAPAAAMHAEGLEHRRRNSRVEKPSAARPAGWCVNGRQQDRGLFRTRGAAGWLAGVLHSQLQRLRSLREGQALRPRKHRPPSHPSSASQSAKKSTLRARRGKSELRAAEWGGWRCQKDGWMQDWAGIRKCQWSGVGAGLGVWALFNRLPAGAAKVHRR